MNPKKYYGSLDSGIKRDDLFSMSDQVPVFVRNIEIASDTTVTRGMLMAATAPQGEYHLATATDATLGNAFFGIAVEDYQADSDHSVTQCYISGVFHDSKIITADSDTAPIELFELRLREQGMWLRSIKNLFGNWNDFFDEA